MAKPFPCTAKAVWTIDRMLTLDFSSDGNTYATNFVHPATQRV